MKASAITRWLVVASMLAAVVTGCWLLSSRGWPSVALVGGAFLVAAASARAFPIATAWVVLFFGAVHYGVLRLALGPTLAALPIWLAAFAGLVVGVSRLDGWHAPPRWRVPLAWWATSVAVSWPIILARELDFSLESPRDGVLLILPSALIQMSVSLWLDWMLRPGSGHESISDSRSTPDSRLPTPVTRLLWPLLAGAVVSALAAIYQRFVDPSWLSGPPWSTSNRTVGMMGDANPLGVLVATFAPLAFVLFQRRLPSSDSRPVSGSRPSDSRPTPDSRLPTPVPVAIALLLWSAGWFSGARSVLLLMAAGVTGLALAALRSRMSAARTVMVMTVAGVVVLVAVVVLAPRATPGTPLGRLVGFLPKTSIADAAYELLWRRDGYGLAAAHAIAGHPVTGVGIGTFTFMSPHLFRELGGIAVPPDNAQNLWRQVLAERGVLGLLPVLWLTLLTAGVVWRSASIVVSAVLAGLGITLLFGFPLQDATIATALATLIALAHEGSTRGFHTKVPHEGSSRGFDTEVPHEGSARGFTEVPAVAVQRAAMAGGLHGGSTWGFAAVLIVSLIAAGVDLAGARGGLGVAVRAQRFGLPYTYGLGEQQPAPDGRGTARAFRSRAVAVLPASGGQLALRGWVRSPEGEALVRVWSDDVLVFNVAVAHQGTFAVAVPVTPGTRAVRLTMTASRGQVLIRGTWEGTAAP